MGNKHSVHVISEAIHELSIDFYEKFIQLAPEKSTETFIYSPFQLFTTLFIYYLCTDGETKGELLKFLRLENASDGSIQHALKRLITDLHQNQRQLDDGCGIQLMSGIFLSESYKNKIQVKFRKYMTMFANKVELQFVDFQHHFLKTVIERWSKECTNGNIHCSTGDDHLAPPLFHVDLFSIVDQFDFACTPKNAHASKMMFYDASNNATEVPSTYAVGKFRFIYDVTFKIRIIELGLRCNPDLGVLVILPDHRDGLKNVKLTNILKEEVKVWLDSFTVESELELFLPRIKMSSLVRVDEIMNRGSTSAIFSENVADLSGMARLTTSPLFLTSLHANYHVDLSFDLPNTEGVNQYSAEESSMYQQSTAVPYRVEHPFKLMIYHRSAKTVFLVASVENFQEAHC